MRNAKFKTISSNSLGTLLNWGLYVLGFLLLYRIGKPYLNTALESFGLRKSDLEKEVERRKRIEQNLRATGLQDQVNYLRIKNDALEIGKHFGVDLAWYEVLNVRYYTEDEEAAIAVLERYSTITLPFLSEEYEGQFSRDLQKDCIKYLSDKQYDSVKYLFS